MLGLLRCFAPVFDVGRARVLAVGMCSLSVLDDVRRPRRTVAPGAFAYSSLAFSRLASLAGPASPCLAQPRPLLDPPCHVSPCPSVPPSRTQSRRSFLTTLAYSFQAESFRPQPDLLKIVCSARAAQPCRPDFGCVELSLMGGSNEGGMWSNVARDAGFPSPSTDPTPESRPIYCSSSDSSRVLVSARVLTACRWRRRQSAALELVSVSAA
jgi:hypothetical protein